MPGFKVSVFDDNTGAPIPQVQASDGGGLINGRIFSAPNVIWAISAAVIGVPLAVAGVRLWRVTTALGGGLTLAFAMWIALINTISESGLAPSQLMSDMLILLIAGGAFLVGMIGGAFRLVVLPAMAAICILGGASIATRGIILRPGLLVPPGPNQQLAFVNIIIIAVGALCGGLSIIFKQRESMIFATSCIGSFLIALSVDLLLNGQDGMSRGLRVLFDMNDNHLADLVGGGYDPPLSSQIIVASSLGLVLVMCTIQHFAFPGPFQRSRPRDRIQSFTDSSSAKGSSSSTPQAPPNRTPIASGPIWRTSVLSLFRAPGRSSNAISSQQMRTPGMPVPGNERRGSAAYNYGQGIYALPSELLHRQSQARNPVVNPSLPYFQRPAPSATLGRSPQFAGIGLRGYQDQFSTARSTSQLRNVDGPPFSSVRNEGLQRTAPSAPRLQGTGSANGALLYASTRTTTVRPVGGTSNPPGASDSNTTRVPRFPAPQTIPPLSHTLAAPPPPTNATPTSASRAEIGTRMLSMSVDSIIDAYGGASDTGYRYGGSRTGEGGRI